MRVLVSSAALLLSFVTQASNTVPKPHISSKVIFTKNGPVAIKSIVKTGDFPHLQFRSVRTSKLLLDAQVGGTEDWQKSDPDTRVRFIVLHRAGLPDPLVVSIAKENGGSDCRYNSALFGEVNGQVVKLTPPLPDHWGRGAVFLSPETARPVILTVTSERYQDRDTHYRGPSHMAVDTYSYDSSQGRFVNVQHTESNTNGLQISGERLLALFGDFDEC